MKTDREFLNGVYAKYQKEKQEGTFKHSFNVKRNITSVAATCLIVFTITAGMAYADISYQEKKKVWKEPEVYDFFKSYEITEDRQKAISKEDAIFEAKEVIKKLGYQEQVEVEKTELIKHAHEQKIYWSIRTKEGYVLEIDAIDKKLWSFSNDNVNDMQILATASRLEAEKVAKELYDSLAYKNQDYQLTHLKKYASGAGWYVDFGKVYGDVENVYQVVRFSFIPETKQIMHLVLFDEKFENNEILLSKQEAEEIAKEKYIQLFKNSEIKKVESKRSIEKMNTFIYSYENPLPEGKQYTNQGIVRNVWKVEINDSQVIFFVDATTGEVIGGDAVK